jgi:hypothetical protein
MSRGSTIREAMPPLIEILGREGAMEAVLKNGNLLTARSSTILEANRAIQALFGDQKAAKIVAR